MTFLMIKNFCKTLENHEILQKKSEFRNDE